MSVVLIPFVFERRRNVEPMPAWGLEGDGVWIRCKCGLVLGIDDHEIAEDGTVSPSIHHSEPGVECGWHVMAKLESWLEMNG